MTHSALRPAELCALLRKELTRRGDLLEAFLAEHAAAERALATGGTGATGATGAAGAAGAAGAVPPRASSSITVPCCAP